MQSNLESFLKIGMTYASLQMFENDHLEMESLISWERRKEIISLDIVMTLMEILQDPTLLLDLWLCIKSIISSELVGTMMKFSEFGFFKFS